MSKSCSASAASGVSAAMRMPCEPVTGLLPSDATTTSSPARRSTSMMVTASSSSKPSASGTSTRFMVVAVRRSLRRASAVACLEPGDRRADFRIALAGRLRAWSRERRLRQRQVGLEAALVDRHAGRREVERGRELERLAVLERHDGLHRALAECLLAEQLRAAVVPAARPRRSPRRRPSLRSRARRSACRARDRRSSPPCGSATPRSGLPPTRWCPPRGRHPTPRPPRRGRRPDCCAGPARGRASARRPVARARGSRPGCPLPSSR